MQYKFNWMSNVPDESKLLAENAVVETVESVHSPIAFCHSDTATVTLSLTGALCDRFVGNFKCSCGKMKGATTGKIDGSSITLEAAQD